MLVGINHTSSGFKCDATYTELPNSVSLSTHRSSNSGIQLNGAASGRRIRELTDYRARWEVRRLWEEYGESTLRGFRNRRPRILVYPNDAALRFRRSTIGAYMILPA